MRFLTAYKVTVTFDPYFEKEQKERLPILTPTDDYENSVFYLKSDTPFGRKPMMFRLCRCRGMLHAEMEGLALMWCVAHRNKQGKRTAPFSLAERFLRSQGDTP